MSIHSDHVPGPGELDALITRAGAVRAGVGGAAGAGPANYGSAAGELAGLMCAVGIADRSAELSLLELQAPPSVLETTVADLAGAAPAPGGAVVTGTTWWCAVTPGRTIVVGERASGERLRGRLDWHRARRPALHVRDLRGTWVALAVLGERTRELLADLGVYGCTGDPRRVPPVRLHPVDGVEALWLLRCDREVVVIVPAAAAATVWRSVLEAGRRLRVCAVGREAVARYALIRRRAPLR